MNKSLIAVALVLASTGVLADTDLQFRGTLIADPCVVATDSEEQLVEFGAVAAKTFMSHPRSAPKLFRLHLADCDLSLGTTVTLTFSGIEDSQQPGAFAVTGGAEGVAIAVEDSDGTAVEPNKALKTVELSAGDTWLDYVAYIQGPDHRKVKEGPFESQAIFFLEYE